MTYVADNIAQLASGLVAMAMCAVAARRRQQRWTGWALLAGSLLVAVCGNAIWFYYNVFLSAGVAWSSLAGDICAVVALPLAIAGVLTLPGALGTAASRRHVVLDGLLIATGMFFISWTLVLSPVYQHTSGGLAVEMFSLGIPSQRLDPRVAGDHLGYSSLEPQQAEPGPGLGRPALGVPWQTVRSPT